MQISTQIYKEGSFFLISVLAGGGFAFVYDWFRVFRRIKKHGVWWIGIEDVLYWLFCAVGVFLLLHRENEGELRAFSFFGMVMGIGLYERLFSALFCGLMLKMARPVAKNGKKLLIFWGRVLKKAKKAIRMGLSKQ